MCWLRGDQQNVIYVFTTRGKPSYFSTTETQVLLTSGSKKINRSLKKRQPINSKFEAQLQGKI